MGGARDRGDELRTRIALVLGGLLLIGGAVTGTALASASSDEPVPAQQEAPRSVVGDVTEEPTSTPAPGGPRPTATQEPPSAHPAPRVPTAIPAGPVGACAEDCPASVNGD